MLGILKTNRLILRPWKDSDAAALYRYASDPDIGIPAGWPPHTSEEDSLGIIRNVFNGPEDYAIALIGNPDEAIGAIALKFGESSDLFPPDDKTQAELGFWIGKPFWGQGLMPEAAHELLRHGFEDLGLTTIWCAYYDGNVKSARAQEKIGFTPHHSSTNVPVPLLNETRDDHVNIITREQWDALQNK